MRSPANNRPTSRVPEWDGIRGVAILLVVFYHYIFGALESNSSGLAHVIRSVFPLSWSGVDLFFVLSGFLIGGILMDQRDSGNYFKTFYLRRVCRIVPVYFAWLILFLVLAQAFAAHSREWQITLFTREIPGFPRWGYFLFLQNLFTARSGLFGSPWLAATWSLAVEEQFYLLLPLTLWFMRPKHRFPVFVVLIAFVPVFRTFLFLFHSGTYLYVLLPCRADALLLGVLCAYLVREPAWFSGLRQNRRWLQLAFALLLLGVGSLTAFVRGRPENSIFGSFEMDTFGFTWIALFYASFLMLATTATDGLPARVLRNRALRHFGLIAYGMYLFHMAIDSLAHGLLLGKSTDINGFTDLAVTALAFAVTWALALVSWNFFEKPIIRWGHSFSYGSKTAVAPGEAVPLASSKSV